MTKGKRPLLEFLHSTRRPLSSRISYCCSLHPSFPVRRSKIANGHCLWRKVTTAATSYNWSHPVQRTEIAGSGQIASLLLRAAKHTIQYQALIRCQVSSCPVRTSAPDSRGSDTVIRPPEAGAGRRRRGAARPRAEPASRGSRCGWPPGDAGGRGRWRRP
jgi:hypothetical protein